jgi:hypothetical protein
MRLRTLLKILALGLSAGAVTHYVRNRRTPSDPLAPDPRDPVQGFEDASDQRVDALAVDALSAEDVEAAQDLASLEVGLDRITGEDDVAIALVDINDVAVIHDSGDLYGVHTPVAVDRAHPDDDQAYVEGQNWFEALETSAIENGAEPEQELSDIVDDEDLLRPPHPSLARDTPVADFGSGGRRGL